MNRIKYLREQAGLLQDELAKQIGSSQKNISNYETEKRNIPDSIKLKLCKLFNCDIEYLMGYTDFNNINFANNSGIDTEGLSKEEIDEIQKQVEYMKWKKNQKKEK